MAAVTAEPGDRPLRVCLVSPKAYPLFNPEIEAVFGGAEVDCYLLATELARDAAFDVSCVTADYGQAAEERCEGVRVLRSIDFRRGAVRGALQVWRALRRADADVYLIKTASLGVFLTAWFCRRHGRAFCYRSASILESNGGYARAHPLVGRLFAWSLRQARAVFVQNAQDRAALRDWLGIEAICVPNGHRLTVLPDEPRTSVLWVGRSEAVKGPHRFLDLAAARPQQAFTMICPRATHDDAYDALVARARGMANVTFHERASRAEVAGFMARSQLVVNTSDSEGFSNVFIEACQAGTPILTWVVDPDGFLSRYDCGRCAGGDAARMTALLDELLEPRTRARLGAHARRYVVETHDIRKVIEVYKQVFRGLAERGAAVSGRQGR